MDNFLCIMVTGCFERKRKIQALHFSSECSFVFFSELFGLCEYKNRMDLADTMALHVEIQRCAECPENE